MSMSMSCEPTEQERWDAYLEGLRKKPEELEDMLPMFEDWVYSGYASEVEWRLAIEMTDLKRRLDAMEEPIEDKKVTLNYVPDANARELADEIAREISLRVRRRRGSPWGGERMSKERDKPVNIGDLKVMVTPSSEDIERMASVAGELSGIEVAIEVTPIGP